MKIRANHARLVAERIARDLLNSKVMKFTEGMDPVVAVAEKHILEDISWEAEIDAEVEDIIDENEEAIEFQRADRKQLFWMVKRKICEEDGFVLDKDDRYSNVAHQILDELYEEDLVFFDVSETRLKSQIVKSILNFGKFQDEIEDRVREKISSYKREIRKGSDEYTILFDKFFIEEMGKLGL